MNPFAFVGALLTASTSVVSSSDWSQLITALQEQISVSTIVGVLATVVGAGVGLVFMWWGIRKSVSVIMAAFKRGKLKI